jgi:hypothetical protein
MSISFLRGKGYFTFCLHVPSSIDHMNLRYSLPIFLLLLLSTFSLPAQTQSLLLYAPPDSAGPGDTVYIPIQVNQFTDMVQLVFSISWNSAVLDLIAPSAYHPALALGAANFGLGSASNGQMTFQWSDPSLLGVSVSGGSTLFALGFELTGSLGDSSALCFVSTPIAKSAQRLVNGALLAVPINDVCGLVSILDVCANFSLTTNTTPDVCGQSNGTILAMASGGLPPYTYSLNGTTPFVNNFFTGLSAGTYHLSGFDSQGCQDSLVLTVNDLPPPVITVDSVVDDACNQQIGSITLSTTGGTPGYQYSLNGGTPQVSATFSGLGSGTYTIVVRDANSCADTTQATLGSFPGPTLTFVSADPATCGQPNASVVLHANGGAPPYLYTWGSTPPQSSDTLTGVAAGPQMFIAYDSNGCPDTLMLTVPATPPPQISSVNISQPTCNQPNGTITLSVSQGVAPFRYRLNQAPLQTSPTFVNLVSGFYQCFVVDDLGCLDSMSVTLVNQPAPVVSIAMMMDATCGLNNGQAMATATGSNGPMSYSWNTQPPQLTATATGLAAGTYVVVGTDSSGCQATDTITLIAIPPPQASVTSMTKDSCGANTGSATVSGSFGTPPYHFDWLSLGQDTASVSGLEAGTYEMVLTDTDGCTDTLMVLIDSLPVPNVFLYALETICLRGTPPFFLIGGVPGGGTYSGPGVNSGVFNPLLAGAGAHPITYTYVSPNGCVGTAVDTLRVIAGPPVPVILRTGSVLSTDVADNYQWFRNGQPIPNAISQVEPLIGNGSYTVRVTDENGCQATSDPFLVTHAAGGEAPSLRVYPNPSQGTCWVDLQQPAALTLLNLLGQPLLHWPSLPAGSQRLDVSDLAGGMYLLQARSREGQMQTLRLFRAE